MGLLMRLRENCQTMKHPAHPARLNLLRIPAGGAAVDRVEDAILSISDELAIEMRMRATF